jgi:hypothetical protein
MITVTITDRTDGGRLDPDTFRARWPGAWEKGATAELKRVERRAKVLLKRPRPLGLRPDGRSSRAGKPRYDRQFVREQSTSGTRGFASLENMQPHAYFVERGRRPGKMPPDDPIRAYLENHRDLAGLTTSEANSLVYLVRRAIGQHGTRGKFVFRTLRTEFTAGVVGPRLKRSVGRVLWAPTLGATL